MIAYLTKNPLPNATYKFILRVVAQPCNGLELQNAEIVPASSKKTARAICKHRNIKPWNF
jgi:hypothetical protein